MIGVLGEFFAMGGYARFVWPAYLIAAAILAVLTGLSLRDLRREEATLLALRHQRRRAADDGAPE
jgi:heme exporter protein D